MAGARRSLQSFRRGSMLAVALTALLLLLLPEELSLPVELGVAQAQGQTGREAAARPEAPADEEPDPAAAETPTRPDEIGRAARDEARLTAERLWVGLLGMLPRLIVSIGALIVAWLVSRLARLGVRAALGRWERSQAVSALVSIGIWVFAVGTVFTVLSGDLRALVGSVGLVGLALSWALQVPIESFTGWLFNAFRGHYRVGDRVLVGEVFGDVYRIDVLTTTVWEIGAPGRAGHVHAEQPTGRLVTFPNSEILTGTVINLTREFPYVWDELAIPVANESDLRLAAEVIGTAARGLLGARMEGPAREYEQIVRRAGLEILVGEDPQVFVLPAESWTDVVVRYLVGARERRLWKSELYVAVTEALRAPDVAGRVLPVYPRQQLQLVDEQGVPVPVPVPATGRGA